MYSLLARIWSGFGPSFKRYVLWLINAKFAVGVRVILFDQQGRVLLLRHRFWKAGSWGLPSGLANHGETLEDTVKREVKEETALDITVDRLLLLQSGFRLRIEATYVGTIVGGEIKLDPKEVLEIGFFAKDELPVGLLKLHRELIERCVDDGKVNVCAP